MHGADVIFETILTGIASYSQVLGIRNSLCEREQDILELRRCGKTKSNRTILYNSPIKKQNCTKVGRHLGLLLISRN
jgi:hypothetical protein